MKKILLILLCLLFTNSVYSQNPEWSLKKSRTFKANNLYGHIDGGAELFLELGFKALTVDYYSNGKSEISVESYEMESAESALAIYLQKCGKEKPVSGIKTRNTGDKFQISCVKGNFFITINNPGGKENLMQTMISFANKSIGKIKDTKKPVVLNLLPGKNQIKGSALIFRGMYSLQSIYTFGEGDVLLLKGKIFGAAADYRDNPSNYTFLCIRYPSAALAANAFNNLISHLDNTKKIIEKNKDYLIFRDHAGKYGNIKIKNDNIEIKINLSKAK